MGYVITPLSNEICPKVKLGDFNVFFFFCANYRSEICLVISPKLSKEQAHL
jgi:hypothetical protein